MMPCRLLQEKTVSVIGLGCISAPVLYAEIRLLNMINMCIYIYIYIYTNMLRQVWWGAVVAPNMVQREVLCRILF